MKKSVAASEKPVKAKEFDKELFKRSVEYNVRTLYRKNLEEADAQQIFQAVSYAIKDRIVENWMETQKAYEKEDPKMVYYMSMEFLMGRALGNNLINLKAYKPVAEALEELGLDLNLIEDQEPDAALGNGGLGRLAACFLDSLATLGYPAYGCGIRYRYGMFKQEIRDGYQVEVPDNWLMNGNPFELRRPEYAKIVKFGGYVSVHTDENGRNVFTQEGYQSVKAVPFDFPIVGYGNGIVNTLRIWDAEPVECFQLDSFDKGDYQKAVEQENLARNIVEVLYPNDNHYAGKELRLKQQYFFISASVQEAVEKYMRKHDDIHKFYEKVTFQLNDTHPTVAIAELMRVLMDDYYLTWEEAWEITTKTCAYTNHTIMAEALEKWPEDMVKSLLPRIYQILVEMNKRLCARLWNFFPGEAERVGRMAIIAYGYIHMANLCVAMTFSTNGVSKLHGDILKQETFHDFYLVMPEKFSAITNGITHRRWLMACNPELTKLICDTIGTDWVKDPELLHDLAPYADDAAFREQFEKIKHNNKVRLSNFLKEHQGAIVDPNFIFDAQSKRLHEYKRQMLNALHILVLYNRIVNDPNFTMRPRVFIFGSKAAPGYNRAKLIIRFINGLSALIAKHPRASKMLQVVFLENYDVSSAQLLIPATEISEQISTASKEASGTGNMKYMMNGAITIGTMDGANVEISEQVGMDNIYIFGMRSDTVLDMYRERNYNPMTIFETNQELRLALTQMIDGTVLPDAPSALQDLYHSLLIGDWGNMADPFFVLKDFGSYSMAQRRIDADYADRDKWNRMAVINTAMSGVFCSDRTIREYNDTIWHLDPLKRKV